MRRPDDKAEDRVRHGLPSHVQKPIVLIGGAPGTGKSTLAGELTARLRLDHRIGTGFIRAVIQSEASEENEPGLFSLTFEADDPVRHLESQARRLQPAVTACIERARREGTSLIIEGSHLIPSLYRGAGHDFFFVLVAPAPRQHLSQVTGSTHSKRQISSIDWRHIQQLDAYYRNEAKLHDVPSTVFDDLMSPLRLLGEHGLIAE